MTYVSTKAVSALSCPDDARLRPLGLVPLGASCWTSSGDLAQSNITAIAQAATGSMNRVGAGFDPTRDSVTASVQNSFALAAVHKCPALAIPFLAGNIFRHRISPPCTNAELAVVIVQACNTYCGSVQAVIVAYNTHARSEFAAAMKAHPNPAVTLVQGSITDYTLHQCPAITNAANMEVIFGGGLSGAIGTATGHQAQIDAEAKKDIAAFWAANPATTPAPA